MIQLLYSLFYRLVSSHSILHKKCALFIQQLFRTCESLALLATGSAPKVKPIADCIWEYLNKAKDDGVHNSGKYALFLKDGRIVITEWAVFMVCDKSFVVSDVEWERIERILLLPLTRSLRECHVGLYCVLFLCHTIL